MHDRPSIQDSVPATPPPPQGEIRPCPTRVPQARTYDEAVKEARWLSELRLAFKHLGFTNEEAMRLLVAHVQSGCRHVGGCH